MRLDSTRDTCASSKERQTIRVTKKRLFVKDKTGSLFLFLWHNERQYQSSKKCDYKNEIIPVKFVSSLQEMGHIFINMRQYPNVVDLRFLHVFVIHMV